MKEDESFHHPQIIYDGFCGLCGSFINFIERKDNNKIFEFTPSQSEKYETLRLKYFSLPQQPESVILIFANKIYYRSNAVLEIINLCGCPILLIKIFRLLPKKLRDFIYDFVAANRHKFIGKRNFCYIPRK